ncbi:MAG: SDR family NAD(P)-dependent oxidoreductase, partial [Pseudomonadota bacterium]
MSINANQGKSEKIAVVTGANNGIGFETTLGMARAGYKIIMACRSLEKAEAARREILRNLPRADLETMQLDVSDFASVRRFADKFHSTFGHLDVLINNAGILLYSAKSNSDGIELQFATNHLGHFLLTSLLFEIIPDDSNSRIVHLSSIAHKGARIHFDDLSCGERGIVAYGQSKLACLIFGEELDRRLKVSDSNIRSVPVHPGGSGSG